LLAPAGCRPAGSHAKGKCRDSCNILEETAVAPDIAKGFGGCAGPGAVCCVPKLEKCLQGGPECT
jgi:hypothetical protein